MPAGKTRAEVRAELEAHAPTELDARKFEYKRSDGSPLKLSLEEVADARRGARDGLQPQRLRRAPLGRARRERRARHVQHARARRADREDGQYRAGSTRGGGPRGSRRQRPGECRYTRKPWSPLLSPPKHRSASSRRAQRTSGRCACTTRTQFSCATISDSTSWPTARAVTTPGTSPAPSPRPPSPTTSRPPSTLHDGKPDIDEFGLSLGARRLAVAMQQRPPRHRGDRQDLEPLSGHGQHRGGDLRRSSKPARSTSGTSATAAATACAQACSSSSRTITR